MAGYVALLYSIVLGGGRRLVMAELKALAAELGLADPRTVVATGNLVFDAPRAAPRRLESRLEPAFAARFGRHVDIIVRTAGDFRRIVAANPFPAESEIDPAHVIAQVSRAPMAPEAVQALASHAVEGERVAVAAGTLWLWLPHGVARSKLASAVTPKWLGVGTARNWNTMRKIAELLE